MNSYSYNTSIQSIGNVNKYPARNSSFTPFNVINPKTNNITQLPYVNSRKTIPLNIKSKLSGSQCVEGLYNVRSNTSLNNSTRVPEQFYNDRIDEKRRNNALMTDTNQAMRIRWNNNTTFNEYPDNNSSFSVKISSEDVDSNSIRFSNLIQKPVNIKSVQYNPYVLPSSQNKPYNSNYNKVSYPDERLTSYSGERSYMTEGDRILQSAALATSKSNIEKRELQNQAYNAFMKHASAPRMLGADISKGINTLSTKQQFGTYHNSAYDCDELAFNYDDVVESSNAIKGRHQPNLDNKVIESNEFINPNDTNYISETTVRETFNNEFDVGIDNKPKKYNENQRQQLNESYLKQLFNNILSSFNTLVTRFRSTDSNLNIQHLISTKLKHRLSEIMNDSDDIQLDSLNLDTILNDSVVQEQLSKIRAVIKNNVTNSRVNIDDVDEYVDSILFNNFITYINTITGNRSNIHNSIHNRKYKNEYQTDINEDYINLETPVSLISDDNGTLIRSTIIRDNDKYLILTRKEYNDDTIEYVFGQVELDELERILRKDISSNDVRLVNSLDSQLDFTNLEYEDYIKLLEYIEDSPYEFIQTTVPIHQYQRDILDNDTNFETLLYGSIDNSKSYTQDNRDETIRLKRHVEGLSTFKDNDEDNYYIHSIHNPTNNNTNDRLNLTNQSKITQEVNPKKIYKTLTNLM